MTNITSNNHNTALNTTNSNSVAFAGTFIPNTTEALDGVDAIQREMAFRNSLGYGLGRILYVAFNGAVKLPQLIYKALPNIGLPTASAEPTPVLDITLSDDEALKLVKKKIRVVKNARFVTDVNEIAKVVEPFLKVFLAARNDGPLTKENFDIFLKYNAGAKILLHSDPNIKFVDNNMALYRQQYNVLDIKADLNDKYLWAEMPKNLIHEFGHAADDTRGSKAFQEDPTIVIRGAYHHMYDADADISKKLIDECFDVIKKAHSATQSCISQGEKCSNKHVKAVKKYNTRSTTHLYSTDSPGMERGRAIVPEDAKIGDKVDLLGDHTVIENTKERIVFTTSDPMAAFIGSVLIVESKINNYSADMPPEVRVVERAKQLDELLTNALKKKLCPILYKFEEQQNQNFAQKIMAEKDKKIEL